MKLIIQNVKTGLYWSNLTGWGSRAGATIFNGDELLYLNLPIDGVWRKVN